MSVALNLLKGTCVGLQPLSVVFFTVHIKTNIVYFVGLCSLPKVSAFMHVTNTNDAGRI